MTEIIHAEDVLIEVHETFPKQTFRNRCEIYGANGILPLSIPVHKPQGSHTKTIDIQISYGIPWQHIHWISIQSAYNSSPYFLYYRDYFEPFYFKKFKFLVDFNSELLETILRLTGKKAIFPFTEDYLKEPEEMLDLRNAFNKREVKRHGIKLSYYQVFSDKTGFVPNLSIIDLLFNEGKQSLNYLQAIYAANQRDSA